MNDYQAIVVGAGPAGAFAAYELGRRGIRTLLLEKQSLPRDKTCGGGLTYKVSRLLPFDLAPVLEHRVTRCDLVWRLGAAATLGGGDELIHMVRRSRFDQFLVEQALTTGEVTLIDRVAAAGCDVDARGVTVYTVRGALRGDYLIAADGANGAIGKTLGLMRERLLLPAVECELAVDRATIDTWQQRASLDVGSLRGSYGWVFPKGEHLNVGVGCFAASSRKAQGLMNYARSHWAFRFPGARLTHSLGSVLPLRPPGAAIARGRVLLAGDAGGLVEAFTGEGIYWALRSGRIAAEAIADDLSRGHGKPAYQAAIDTQLMPDLLEARRWAHMYLWWPGSVFTLPTRWPAAWRAIERLLRGELRFSEMRGLLGWPGRAIGLLPTTL